MTSLRFLAVEMDAYAPGGEAPGGAAPFASAPWADTPPDAGRVSVSEIVLASDIGYRTRESDAGGLRLYPGTVDQAFALDRAMKLAPGAAAVAASWGSLRLANAGRRYDALAARSNADGRLVRVLMGWKSPDARGYLVDPPYASLMPFFVGIGQPWFLSEEVLEVPLRDASYWIERPYLQNVYAGISGLEGTPDMAGQIKPRVRGGTSADPVRNVTPKLIDPVDQIYQFTDGPGTIVALYEGGDAQHTYAGDVADLYSGVTPSGQYRTNNANGCFQLGTRPTRPITVDVTGGFVVAGAQSSAATIARYILTEDMALPPDLIDVASFTSLAALYPWTAGWSWTEASDGAAAAGLMLAAIGARLVPTRDGRLKAIALRTLPAGATPKARLSTAEIIGLTPRALGAPLDPPPYRWRVGYQRCHTVQTSDLDPDVSDARKQFLASADRFAPPWASTAVLAAYRNPQDPPELPTALLQKAHAEALAQSLGALWGTVPARRLYDVVVPTELGLSLDVGDAVSLVYPIHDLDGGKLGQVVGDSLRGHEDTMRLQVLV
jgi:hypothetical protein